MQLSCHAQNFVDYYFLDFIIIYVLLILFIMSKYFLMLVLFLILQSCTANKVIEVKSPCVSGDGGPCGPRRPINTWLYETKARV